jgi:hypothetical protein
MCAGCRAARATSFDLCRDFGRVAKRGDQETRVSRVD